MKKEERNYVVLAMIRAGKKSVAHGKTKKADRRAFKSTLRQVMDAY